MQDRIDLGRAKKGIVVVAVLGVATMAIIIALTFKPDTLSALSKIDGLYLWLAIAAAITSWMFSALCFYVLTRAVKRPITLYQSFVVFLGGTFFGNVTPFSSGLLPTQIYILTREGLSAGQATAVVSTRATISSWLFVALGFGIFLGFRSSLSNSVRASLLGIAIVAAVWSILTLFFIKQPECAKRAVERWTSYGILAARVGAQRLESIRMRIYQEIDYLSSNLKDLFSLAHLPTIAVVFVYEIVAWFSLFAILPLVLAGFHIVGSLGTLAFRILLLFSLTPVSPTPGGSGVVEAAFTGLLIGLIPENIIGLVVLIWRAITYYIMTIAGGIIILRFVAQFAFNGQTAKEIESK